MTARPEKIRIGIARFPYAGNGGTSSEVPEVGDWLVKTSKAVVRDRRCYSEIAWFKRADTPIPMVRNLACRWAVENGIDVLVMVDSDQVPDLYLKTDKTAKPFFQSSLDFLLKHWDRGPCVIMAPYCGPNPHPLYGGESFVYVFRWHTTSNGDNRSFKLEMIPREDAAIMQGISSVAAGPTGLIMLDTRLFSYKGSSSPEGASWQALTPPWFDYEYTDEYESQKASTEDVFFTRNCSLNGIKCYCNWDAWAGHAKPTVIGRPIVMTVDGIREEFRKAVMANIHSNERIVELNPEKTVEEIVGETAPPVGPDGTLVVEDETGHISVGFRTSEEDLASLARLVRFVIDKRASDSFDSGEAPSPVRILEIGSWVGESALAMREAAGDTPVEINCVDTWQGSANDATGEIVRRVGGSATMMDYFKQNVSKYLGESIIAHLGRSPEIAESFVGQTFDLIFLDGGHAYHEISADIRAWLPHVAPGGVICGHDYCQDFPGVIRAADELGPDGVVGKVWWKVVAPEQAPVVEREPQPAREEVVA